MLKAFFGDEGFLVHSAQVEFKEEFEKKNPQSQILTFWGGESAVDDFLNSLAQGGGLFAQKKLVILKNFFAFNKNDQEKILKFLKKGFDSSNNTILLFIWEGKIKASKLLNFIKKKAEKSEFKKATPFEAEKFVLDKIKGLVEIETTALKKIVLIFNADLWALDREIEKLINFKTNQKITEEDIDLLCDGQAEIKIFDLVDAIGTRNKTKAIELLTSLLKKGEDGFQLLSMILFQFRNLALVGDCKRRGIFDSKQISQKTGLHPYVSQKTLNQLGFFSLNKVKEIYRQISVLDINSKSGKINIKEALQDLIIKV